MKQDNRPEGEISDLRGRAERRLQERFPAPEALLNLTGEEVKVLVHELQVYQIELEVQNEELRRAQTELEMLKDKYLDLYDFAPAGYVTVGETGLILEANLTACRLLGVERKSLINRPFSRFVCPEDQDKYYLVMRDLFETKAPKTCDVQLVKKQSEPFHAQLNASVMQDGEGAFHCCRTIISDITERKHAENELQRNEATLRALLQAAPIGIGQVFEGRRLGWINETLAEITGRQPDEVVGKSARIFYENKGEFQRVEAVKIPQVNATGTGSVETRFMHVDGGVHDILLTTRVVDPKDRSKGLVFTAVDITDRKNAEREKDILEGQLRESQKMEAVGTLAGGIAHDFNNLLHIISGHAELLETELARRGMGFSELDAIRQASARGADLVKQILTFSRRVDAKFESINLNDDVKKTERLLYRTIPKMIEIELKLEEELKPVMADSGKVEQILINLALNSNDAMPEGGKLTIETRNMDLRPEHCQELGAFRTGPYVLLKITDTGQGIPEDALEHIFEPFFTTKGLADGTGLGLATVFGIVKMHGGHIICDSEVGKGTAFSIYFPAAEEAKPVIAAIPEVAVDAGGGETILVVDDEPLIADLGKKVLEKAGYSVLTATSGKEALDVYSQHKSHIALIILDLIMPGIGGKQCLEELLKINPQVKVLIASGLAVTGETKAFLDSAAKGMVSKPFNMKELLRSVHQLLNEI